MNNHNFFRMERLHKGWGGVGILVNKRFTASEFILSNSKVIESNLNIEFLCLKVQYKYNKSFLIGCLYRPPKQDKVQLTTDFDTIDEIFSELIISKLF